MNMSVLLYLLSLVLSYTSWFAEDKEYMTTKEFNIYIFIILAINIIFVDLTFQN